MANLEVFKKSTGNRGISKPVVEMFARTLLSAEDITAALVAEEVAGKVQEQPCTLANKAAKEHKMKKKKRGSRGKKTSRCATASAGLALLDDGKREDLCDELATEVISCDKVIDTNRSEIANSSGIDNSSTDKAESMKYHDMLAASGTKKETSKDIRKTRRGGKKVKQRKGGGLDRKDSPHKGSSIDDWYDPQQQVQLDSSLPTTKVTSQDRSSNDCNFSIRKNAKSDGRNLVAVGPAKVRSSTWAAGNILESHSMKIGERKVGKFVESHDSPFSFGFQLSLER